MLSIIITDHGGTEITKQNLVLSVLTALPQPINVLRELRISVVILQENSFHTFEKQVIVDFTFSEQYLFLQKSDHEKAYCSE